LRRRATETKSSSARQERARLLREAPVLFFTAAFLCIAEVLMIFFVPVLAPDTAYLRLYLGPKARAAMLDLLEGHTGYLEFDDATGWRNRPGACRGPWQIDEHGSRSTQRFTSERTKPVRALFLGSSLINGGTSISSQDTISAGVEDSETEALNFGTMLYALDQMYLAYHRELHKYNANVVIVGVAPNETAGLLNRYVPFRNRAEINMPFFKPRFVLNNDIPELIAVPPGSEQKSFFDKPDLLRSLQASDHYYPEFMLYQHFGLMPISSGALYLYKRAKNITGMLRGAEDESTPLLKAIMAMILSDARSQGASVIFLALPDMASTYPPQWRKYFPDKYGLLINQLAASGLKLLDVREAFRRSSLAAPQLYAADGIHFTPRGNRVIAQLLRREIDGLRHEITAPRGSTEAKAGPTSAH
jgi:hypothetical protein